MLHGGRGGEVCGDVGGRGRRRVCGARDLAAMSFEKEGSAESFGLSETLSAPGGNSFLDAELRRGFVRKVYGILAAQLLLTFGMCVHLYTRPALGARAGEEVP